LPFKGIFLTSETAREGKNKKAEAGSKTLEAVARDRATNWHTLFSLEPDRKIAKIFE
jgi:hypothetical protein